MLGICTRHLGICQLEACRRNRGYLSIILRPAAVKAVLCGNLRLAPATRLAARLRPVKVLLGLGEDVLSVTTLETLSVISIHVPRQLKVSSAPGTRLELYHFACSVLPPQRIRIKPCVAYVFITRN